MADKYIYAVARIRALEMTLMSQAVIEQLVATDSYKKAVQFIIEKGWGDSDKASMDENDILRAETDKTWAAVAEMVELDYVNDDRYAEARAHSLLAARKSRRAAAQNLRQKGLSGAQIEQALESVYAPDADGESPELEAAAALVRSRYMKKLADGRRDLVVAALQRRGFAYSVIKEAIKRAEEE